MASSSNVPFRRTISEPMMVQCQENLETANSITFTNLDDKLIWRYETNGVYSSKLIYTLINFIVQLATSCTFPLESCNTQRVALFVYNHATRNEFHF
jgi:hypothetical protein